MEHKAPYNTRQSREVADALRAHPGQHMTAAELCEAFARQGRPMGRATVYRQLEKLVAAGLVTKYTVDGTTGACYAYTGPSDAPCEESCYHCKCERCGALIHLHCHEVEHLCRHMLDHHGFALDPRRTVFYGLCENCRAAQGG